MRLTGTGVRAKLERRIVGWVKRYLPGGLFHDTPVAVGDFLTLLRNGADWGTYIPVRAGGTRRETLPEIFNHTLGKRFTRYAERSIPESWIARLPNGKVYGKDTNLIMSSGNLLSTDLSREFGAYGGKPVSEGDLFTRKLHYGRSEHLKGTTAVITTKGHANFHHWNYDCLPRLQMLREAGLLDQVDRFLIRHQGQRFQLESLARMGLPLDRIHALPEEDMLITSDVLLVPSLPSVLGTVSPWVTDFLAGLYDPDGAETSGYERIFLSRKKVTTRQIVNQAEFKALLEEHGIRELFPEDHSVAEMARIVAGARFVISAHGSGLSNLCFLKPGAVVVDILMPYHQDAYYWQITNIRGGRYIGFFGAGEHPDDDVDLVANKIDEDIHIDMEQMRTLLNRELKGG